MTSIEPSSYTPAHFTACDIMAIGRRVVMLADANPNGFVKAGDLANPSDTYRGNCSCFSAQLKGVEHDLTVARRNGRSVVELTVKRDALRRADAAQERTAWAAHKAAQAEQAAQ